MDRWETERALRASGLPPLARLVALSLLTRAERGMPHVPPRYAPSLSVLAADTGLSRSTVAQCLNVLERSGWVTRERDLKRAVSEKIPTGYRIHPPASPGHGPALVRGTDQQEGVLVRDTDQVSPGHGPALVRESDITSPGHGPRPERTRTKPEQLKAAPSAPPARARAPAREDETAHTILAAFIDWDRDSGGQLTKRTTGQLAKTIAALLDEGIDEKHIRQGLADWRGKAQHPSTLDSFVNAAMNGHNPPVSRKQAETNAMFARALERARARDAMRGEHQ